MSLTQLNPTIPVVTVAGRKGLALAWVDYSEEHHLLWVVAFDDDGEVWVIPNPEIRLRSNYSMGRQS